jgi:hypothetical protein
LHESGIQETARANGAAQVANRATIWEIADLSSAITALMSS